MPTLDQLVARLQAIKASRITVTAYRSTTPEYAKEADLNTGEGSKLHGSRWNPPGIAAVYASFTPETAMEESLAHFRYYGIPFHAAMPRSTNGKAQSTNGDILLILCFVIGLRVALMIQVRAEQRSRVATNLHRKACPESG
jgi:hypothetical protein